MVNGEQYTVQINELKKLSYNFYRQLANGTEPLTYTYREDDQETQVEVIAHIIARGISVTIGFDTSWALRQGNTGTETVECIITDRDVWEKA